MPRGNLETIHPRALVLTAVRKHLDKYDVILVYKLDKEYFVNQVTIFFLYGSITYYRKTCVWISTLEWLILCPCISISCVRALIRHI